MPASKDGSVLEMLVTATLFYDVISATNSSPQTTEINASVRAATLMKWVWLGIAQATAFATIAVFIDYRLGRPIWPPLVGGGIAATLLLTQYIYARNSGLSQPGPPTEVYGGYG